MIALALIQVDVEEAVRQVTEEPAALLVTALALFTLSLIQIPLAPRMRAWLLRAAPRPQPIFAWIDLAALIVGFIVGQMLVLLGAAYVINGSFDVSEDLMEKLTVVQLLTMTAVGQLVPALLVLLFAATRKGGMGTLGLTRLTPGWRPIYGVGRYLLALPMVFGFAMLSSYLFLKVAGKLPEQEIAVLIEEGIREQPLLIALFAVGLVPLLEEILFRGFLLELLLPRVGRAAAVLVSSVIFAALHGPEAFLPIFGLALILGIIKLETRSLAVCWVVHGLHNGASMVPLLF